MRLGKLAALELKHGTLLVGQLQNGVGVVHLVVVVGDGAGDGSVEDAVLPLLLLLLQVLVDVAVVEVEDKGQFLAVVGLARRARRERTPRRRLRLERVWRRFRGRAVCEVAECGDTQWKLVKGKKMLSSGDLEHSGQKIRKK